jgi:pyochelin biosynthesis protein PchC
MASATDNAALWLRRYHPCADNAPRLVCFPHAGGSAVYYHQLSRTLAPEIEVLAVQYPGRHDRRREVFVDDLRELARRSCDALAGEPAGPYAFFGHSMGALIAYETALLVRERGWPMPERLFASARRGPATVRPAKVYNRDSVLDELRKLGGTDPRFLNDPELLDTILPAAMNDYRAIQAYRWADRPPLPIPITALIGDADPQSTVAEAAAWGRHSIEPLDLRVFPGGHFYLDAHLPDVAGVISGALTGSLEGSAR